MDGFTGSESVVVPCSKRPTPDSFFWYVRNYGINVNLFVNDSQIARFEAVRAGIWARTTPGAGTAAETTAAVRGSRRPCVGEPATRFGNQGDRLRRNPGARLG